MPRPDKVAAVDEVRQKLASSTATVLTEYRGLTVSQLAELRAELRKANAEYRVSKNTLARIAARDAGIEVPDELLTGPTAMAFCADDPVGVAKALRTFAKANPDLVVKGALLEGRLLSAEETNKLADLESREELLSKMAGMIQTLLSQPARLAQASLTKMAQLLAALQAQKPEGDAPEAPAAEETAPAEAAEESAPEEAAVPEAETPEAPAPEAASEEPSETVEAAAPAEAEPAAEEPKAEDGTEEAAEEAPAEEAATEE